MYERIQKRKYVKKLLIFRENIFNILNRCETKEIKYTIISFIANLFVSEKTNILNLNECLVNVKLKNNLKYLR